MICLKHNKEIIGVIDSKSLCEDCKIEMNELDEYHALLFKWWRIIGTGSVTFFVCLFYLGYDKINVTSGMPILGWGEIIGFSVCVGILWPFFLFLLMIVICFFLYEN